MKTKRVVKWLFLIGLLWLFQVVVFMGTVFVIAANSGEDSKSPDWINVWGTFGVIVPAIILIFVALGFAAREVIMLFLEDK